MRSMFSTAERELRLALDEARRKSPATVAVLVACVAVLALVPALLTLLRADTYRSSTIISTTPAARTAVSPTLRAQIPSILSGPLESPRLQKDVARQVESLPSGKDLPAYITVG